ncbi:MAG: ATP-binding cassette domain-containing protein [Bacteroidetes bacterium]|nr:ATP-binding cassette domain-containing protein [Bacteroidota bacterium]
MIRFEDVSIQYPGNEHFSLHGLSFSVEKGELVVLSAPTGAGKSSILKLLTAQLKPASGRIFVGETEVSSLRGAKIAAYRRRIGCVFQDLSLLEEKTIYENVAFALEVQGITKRAKIDPLVMNVLDRVGLTSLAGQFPYALSLGERQRAAIARAIVTEPLVLLADNPTSQLDAETAVGIFRILANEHLRGMTIFLATTRTVPLPALPSQTRYLGLRGSGSGLKVIDPARSAVAVANE